MDFSIPKQSNTMSSQSLENLSENDKIIKFYQELDSASTTSDARKLIKLYSEYLKQSIIIPILLNSDKAYNVIVSDFLKDSSLLDPILDEFHIISTPTPEQQQIRQMLFECCRSRNEISNCYKIIKSVNLNQSPSSFLEFSTYATSFISIINNNQEYIKDFFNLITNYAALFRWSQSNWLIEFAYSFASLIKPKSIHPAALELIRIRSKSSLYNNFKNSNIFYDVLPGQEISMLSQAPPFLRCYYLSSKFKLDLRNLSTMSDPADVYNCILNEIKSQNPNAKKLLDNLPPSISLPFYYLNLSNDPKSFHSCIEKCLTRGNFNQAFSILTRCARSRPALISPHFDKLSTHKIEEFPELISLLIKAEILDFTRLYPFISQISIDRFNKIKPIIREGISQLLRMPKSHRITSFILEVLGHFFSDISGGINWSSVAENFSDDPIIASCMLQSNDEESQTLQSTILLNWQNNFKEFIKVAPSYVHTSISLPLLIIMHATDDFDSELVKWALQRLPVINDESTKALLVYILFEISKLSITHNKKVSLFKGDLSPFAYASSAILGSNEQLNYLYNEAKRNNYYSILLLQLLQLQNVSLSNDIKEFLQKPKIVSKTKEIISIFKLLSTNTSKFSTDSANSFNSPVFQLRNDKTNNKRIIEIIEHANKITLNELESIANKSKFSSFEDMENHFLLMSIICLFHSSSHTVTKGTIDKILSLIFSKASNSKQISFGLRVLSLSSANDVEISQIIGPKNQAVFPALLALCVHRNDVSLVHLILKFADDYGLVKIIKPVIEFINENKLIEFVKRTAPSATLDVILDSLEVFVSPAVILEVFSEIRLKKYDFKSFLNHSSQIQSALLKLPSKEFKSNVYKEFDDFSLFCAFEINCPTNSLCWNLAEGNYSLNHLFLNVTMNQKGIERRKELGNDLFAFLDIASSKEIDRLFVAMLTVKFAENYDGTLNVIRKHFQINSDQLSEEIILILAPEIIKETKLFNSLEKLDHFQKMEFQRDENKEIQDIVICTSHLSKQ